MNAPIADLRVDYRAGELEVNDLAPTWHEQLSAWLGEAREAGLPDPNAMVLATVDDEYRVTSRTVLAKDIDARGVTFFTNYTSEKSHQLRQTRQASVTFPWYGLQRQATVIGTVELLGKEETAEYWRGRPRTSQLGAWASPQSTTVRDRQALEDLFATVEARFEGEDVPPPPHWGGWRLLPTHVEFWQGRTSRLHDRLRFRFNPARGDWVVERLAP